MKQQELVCGPCPGQLMCGDVHPFGGRELCAHQAGFSLHVPTRTWLWFDALSLSRSWCHQLVGHVLTWMSSAWYPPFPLLPRGLPSGGFSLVANGNKFWGEFLRVRRRDWHFLRCSFFFLFYFPFCILGLQINAYQVCKEVNLFFMFVTSMRNDHMLLGEKSCWGRTVLKNTWTNI